MQRGDGRVDVVVRFVDVQRHVLRVLAQPHLDERFARSLHLLDARELLRFDRIEAEDAVDHRLVHAVPGRERPKHIDFGLDANERRDALDQQGCAAIPADFGDPNLAYAQVVATHRFGRERLVESGLAFRRNVLGGLHVLAQVTDQPARVPTVRRGVTEFAVHSSGSMNPALQPTSSRAPYRSSIVRS